MLAAHDWPHRDFVSFSSRVVPGQPAQPCMDPDDELRLRRSMEIFVQLRQTDDERRRIAVPFTQGSTVLELKDRINAELVKVGRTIIDTDEQRLFYGNVLLKADSHTLGHYNIKARTTLHMGRTAHDELQSAEVWLVRGTLSVEWGFLHATKQLKTVSIREGCMWLEDAKDEDAEPLVVTTKKTADIDDDLKDHKQVQLVDSYVRHLEHHRGFRLRTSEATYTFYTTSEQDRECWFAHFVAAGATPRARPNCCSDVREYGHYLNLKRLKRHDISMYKLLRLPNTCAKRICCSSPSKYEMKKALERRFSGKPSFTPFFPQMPRRKMPTWPRLQTKTPFGSSSMASLVTVVRMSSEHRI